MTKFDGLSANDDGLSANDVAYYLYIKAWNSKHVGPRQCKPPYYGSREDVWADAAFKTRGGLTKSMLHKNKKGQIVSAKELAKFRRQGHKNLSRWSFAMLCARHTMGIKTWMPCRKGTLFYQQTMYHYKHPGFTEDYIEWLTEIDFALDEH